MGVRPYIAESEVKPGCGVVQGSTENKVKAPAHGAGDFIGVFSFDAYPAKGEGAEVGIVISGVVQVLCGGAVLAGKKSALKADNSGSFVMAGDGQPTCGVFLENGEAGEYVDMLIEHGGAGSSGGGGGGSVVSMTDGDATTPSVLRINGADHNVPSEGQVGVKADKIAYYPLTNNTENLGDLNNASLLPQGAAMSLNGGAQALAALQAISDAINGFGGITYQSPSGAMTAMLNVSTSSGIQGQTKNADIHLIQNGSSFAMAFSNNNSAYGEWHLSETSLHTDTIVDIDEWSLTFDGTATEEQAQAFKAIIDSLWTFSWQAASDVPEYQNLEGLRGELRNDIQEVNGRVNNLEGLIPVPTAADAEKTLKVKSDGSGYELV